MKIQTTRPGFIMVLTLMITALAVILVSYLANKSSVFVPMAKVMTDREKAQQLASGGVQLAMSKLAYADVQEKGKEEEKQTQQQQQGAKQQPEKGGSEKQILESLLPSMNRWQRFTFDKVKDGFEGTVDIYIACEAGKININQLYDFSKHAFVGKQEETKNNLKIVFDGIRKEIGGEISIEVVEKFLKDRKFKLQDVTDLLRIKAFEPFKERLFCEQSHAKKRPLYLTDIFTVWSQTETVEPWLMSESLMTVLGLKSVLVQSSSGQEKSDTSLKNAKEKISSLLKDFQAQYTWPASWDKGLQKLYEKEFKALPKGIQSLFGSTFGPHIFSVVSYGTVGKVVHRLFAVIEVNRAGTNREQPATVSIKKLYWI